VTERPPAPTDAAAPPIGYALIGAGKFGLFACQNYAKLDDVRLCAVADADAQAAQRVADQLGVDAAASVDDALARVDVELAYIAAPPWTHRELTEKSLRAGKHVLCEKPLALTADDAQAMLDLAREKNLLLVADLLMRYNPLCEAVKQIIDRRLLGEPLHGFFENYAKDEPLPPGHWFWDPAHSGGIFVEHAVHFFDLFRWWLGEMKLESAQSVRRPNSEITEQVQCVCRYDNDVLVNFYHGFTQAERMDRQEMRILFERGTLQLVEWMPTKLQIDCIVTDRQLSALQDLLPHAVVETVKSYRGDERQVTSRHKPYEVDGRYLIRADTGMEKLDLYGHALRGLLADQVAFLRAPSHARRITEDHGRTSLVSAAAAQCLADTHAG